MAAEGENEKRERTPVEMAGIRNSNGKKVEDQRLHSDHYKSVK
jgi:hypothetical protein